MELLTIVAFTFILGALLFTAATVLVTIHDAVKRLPPALHRIMRQIPAKASLSHSKLLAAVANAKTHLGVAASALVLGEARNRIAHLR